MGASIKNNNAQFLWKKENHAKDILFFTQFSLITLFWHKKIYFLNPGIEITMKTVSSSHSCMPSQLKVK